jgi:hypothetical protein
MTTKIITTKEKLGCETKQKYMGKIMSTKQNYWNRGTKLAYLGNKNNVLDAHPVSLRTNYYVRGTNLVYSENKNLASEEHFSSTRGTTLLVPRNTFHIHREQ